MVIEVIGHSRENSLLWTLFLSLDHHSSLGYLADHCRSSSISVPRQLYKKVDEVELSQPASFFSKGVKPACRCPQEKCPHPRRGVHCYIYTDRFAVNAVNAPFPPLPMSSKGSSKSLINELKI